MNRQVAFSLNAQSVRRRGEMRLQSRRCEGNLVGYIVNCCKSHHTSGLLIFHQREGYLRKVLRCSAGIPEAKIDLHSGKKTRDIPTQLRQKGSPASTHTNPILCNKRNPAEVAVWTCVAFSGPTASLEKTKCNCWH